MRGRFLILFALMLGLMASAFGQITKSQAETVLAPRKALRIVSAFPFSHQSGVVAVQGVDDDATYICQLPLVEASRKLYLAYTNLHVNTSGGETGGGILTVSASVYYYDGTQSIGPLAVVTWNGQSSVVIGPKGLPISDPIHVGLIPAGTDYTTGHLRIHTRVRVAPGAVIPHQGVLNWASQGYFTGDRLLNADANGALTNRAIYTPAAILSEGREPGGLAILGDSNTAGTGETTGRGGGFAIRACERLGIGAVYAPKSGEKMAEFAGTISRRQGRIMLASLAPHWLVNYGVNDLTGASPRTLAQLKADGRTVANLAASMGCKVWFTTVVPNVDMGTAGQPSRMTPQAEADRKAYNTFLRSPEAKQFYGVGFGGVVDTASKIECNDAGVLTLNGGKWLSSMTNDGLHGNTDGHTAMGTALDPYRYIFMPPATTGLYRGWLGMATPVNNYAFSA